MDPSDRVFGQLDASDFGDPTPERLHELRTLIASLERLKAPTLTRSIDVDLRDEANDFVLGVSCAVYGLGPRIEPQTKLVLEASWHDADHQLVEVNYDSDESWQLEALDEIVRHFSETQTDTVEGKWLRWLFESAKQRQTTGHKDAEQIEHLLDGAPFPVGTTVVRQLNTTFQNGTIVSGFARVINAVRRESWPGARALSEIELTTADGSAFSYALYLDRMTLLMQSSESADTPSQARAAGADKPTEGSVRSFASALNVALASGVDNKTTA